MGELPLKYNEQGIKNIVHSIFSAISVGNSEDAQMFLQNYMQLRPACLLTLQNNMSGQTNEKIKNYFVENIGNNGERFQRVDRSNPEIYQKLIKAGNSKQDAEYGAIGVTTMEEAIERLKQSNKRY